MIFGTGQISLLMSESCFTRPSTASQRRPAFGWPTSDTGCSGAIGAEWSKPLVPRPLLLPCRELQVAAR
jgi:hypothetical protein